MQAKDQNEIDKRLKKSSKATNINAQLFNHNYFSISTFKYSPLN